MAKTNYTERIARAGIWVFLVSIGSTIIGYLLRIFLARNLSISEFGLFYAVLAFISFFWLFKDLGIGSAIAKFIPEFYVKKESGKIKSSIIFSTLFQYTTGFFIFLFLFLLSDFISINVFHTMEAKHVLQILAIEFLIANIILKQIIQGFQRMKAFALVELTRVLLVSFFVIVFLPLSLVKLAFGYLFASIAVQLIFSLYIIRSYRKFFREKLNITKKLVKETMGFGALVLAGGIAGTFISYSDTLVLTITRTLPEVGLYQIALPTSQILWVFASSLSAVLLPVFSEIWAKKEKELLSNALSLLIKFSFIFMIPSALIIISFPEIIINTLFGNEYLSASLALQILSVSAIFYTLMIVCSTTITAIGKPGINTKIIIFVACFNLITSIILIPIFGIVGAATTTVFSYLIGFLLLSNYARKYVRLDVQWRSLAKAFSIGIASLAFIYLIKALLVMEPIPEAVLCLVIAIGFYGMMLFYTKTITKSDVQVFTNAGFYIPEKLKRIVIRFVRD